MITGVMYSALAMASSLLLRALTGTIAIPIVLLALGVVLLVVGTRKQKAKYKILGIVVLALSAFAILQISGLLFGEEIPILALGIPAVMSIYFDLFSGFVQALVFSLLTMVYISGACPPPEESSEMKINN